MLLDPGPIAPLDLEAFRQSLAPVVPPLVTPSGDVTGAAFAGLEAGLDAPSRDLADAATPSIGDVAGDGLDGIVGQSHALDDAAQQEPSAAVVAGMTTIDGLIGRADSGLAEDLESPHPPPFEPPPDTPKTPRPDDPSDGIAL